jgi:hypothetical protein
MDHRLSMSEAATTGLHCGLEGRSYRATDCQFANPSYQTITRPSSGAQTEFLRAGMLGGQAAPADSASTGDASDSGKPLVNDLSRDAAFPSWP